MKYISKIEHDIIQVKPYPVMGYNEYNELVNECMQWGDRTTQKENVLVDLSEHRYEITSHHYSTIALFQKLNTYHKKKNHIRKEAIYGNINATLKGILSLVWTITGRKNIKFFEDREEAIRWLIS